MESLLFTPAAVADLLSQIPELHDKEVVVVSEGSDITFAVGDANYTVSGDITDILVNPAAVEQVEAVNDDALDDITDESDSTIESGIIKEVAKTLLLGGLVRLTSKLLRK